MIMLMGKNEAVISNGYDFVTKLFQTEWQEQKLEEYSLLIKFVKTLSAGDH